jgi:Cft2 family RNA processing exonuclease
VSDCHGSVYSISELLFLRHISNLPQPRGWEKKIAEGPPCVVLASPGFMQTGPSRELFELWAPDSRNGLIVTGYSIEGTLARVSHTWFALRVRYLRRLLCLSLVYPENLLFFHPNAFPSNHRLNSCVSDTPGHHD